MKTASVALAAAVLVLPGQAESQAGCRGETLSELNDCVVATTPQAETSAAEVAPVTRRTRVGGALQPTDLRADPRPSAPPSAPEVGGTLASEATEITTPELYGLTRDGRSEFYEVEGRIVRVDRTTRQILGVTQFGDEAGTPGTATLD